MRTFALIDKDGTSYNITVKDKAFFYTSKIFCNFFNKFIFSRHRLQRTKHHYQTGSSCISGAFSPRPLITTIVAVAVAISA